MGSAAPRQSVPRATNLRSQCGFQKVWANRIRCALRKVPQISGVTLLDRAFDSAVPYIAIAMNNGKSLLKSNQSFRNGAVREAMIVRHAVSSARIEGVKLALQRAKRLARASRFPRLRSLSTT